MEPTRCSICGITTPTPCYTHADAYWCAPKGESLDLSNGINVSSASVSTQSPPPPPTNDPIHLPQHYARFKIEPIRFIMENKLPFEVGNVVKYVCRHDAKNGIEDLKKARRYLDMMIAKAEGKEDFWK